MSYEFLFTFFFYHCRSFTSLAASIFLFLPTATKFSRCSFSKKCLPCFLSLLLALCRSFFSLIFAGLSPTFSFFPPFSFSISKFVDITTNISLILETTRIQKQFPLSVFVFIDSLVASASQYAGGYAISRQINLELHLGCHTCWLSYFTLVWLWCGRTAGGRADGQVITKIYQMGRLAFS